MKTVNHAERQSFVKYDNEHFLLYLNETPATFTMPEHEEPTEGYSYTGNMEDGSTEIEVKNVTDENRRDKFVSGLIATRYTMDAQIALLANGKDTEQHEQELRDFEMYRSDCKQKVDELLSR